MSGENPPNCVHTSLLQLILNLTNVHTSYELSHSGPRACKGDGRHTVGCVFTCGLVCEFPTAGKTTAPRMSISPNTHPTLQMSTPVSYLRQPSSNSGARYLWVRGSRSILKEGGMKTANVSYIFFICAATEIDAKVRWALAHK